MNDEPLIISSDGNSFSLKSEIHDWLEAVCFAVIAVILVFSFFVRTAEVSGTSMVPTLKDKDRVLLLNTSLSAPQIGDVIVITQKTNVNHPLIKRVIATEGQTVNIDFEHGKVYVDDILLEEDFINELTMYCPKNHVTFPFTVGKGKLFVMGDNRNASTDSRDSGVGEIDSRYILGKAFYRIYPFNTISKIK